MFDPKTLLMPAGERPTEPWRPSRRASYTSQTLAEADTKAYIDRKALREREAKRRKSERRLQAIKAKRNARRGKTH